MERKIVEQLISGKGFNSICRNLAVGRNRVAHIREKARDYGYLDRSIAVPPYPEALFPEPVDGRSLKASEPDLQLQTQKQWIEERLQAGWQPVTIFEELQVHLVEQFRGNILPFQIFIFVSSHKRQLQQQESR